MSARVVYCTASRGRNYRVVFHGEEPFAVFSLYRRFKVGTMESKEVVRALWHAGDGHISLTAFCAINSAKRKIADQARAAG